MSIKIGQSYGCKDFSNMIPLTLDSLLNTLIKFKLSYYEDKYFMPLLFIVKFIHLCELVFLFSFTKGFKDFENLQHTTFSQLNILKLEYRSPKYEHLSKFLENNGKNLKELYIKKDHHLLRFAILQFCPNLKFLYARFMEDEGLQFVMNHCRRLEGVKVYCCHSFLDEFDLLKTIVEDSPQSFCEIKICYTSFSETKLNPSNLEFFFTGWKNYVPKRSFSLVTTDHFNKCKLINNSESMKIIEKYVRLGVINFTKSHFY